MWVWSTLTLSIRERPKRIFKQKTMAVRISLRNFHPLSLSVIDFSAAAHTFFVRVARPDGLGEKEGFLRIRTVPAVIVDGREISLTFERGTRTFPYFEVPSIPMVVGIRGLNLTPRIKRPNADAVWEFEDAGARSSWVFFS
ncbi:hypothetical protein AVEN_217420-1 [Araneus ventricosus]|uniref:Uncharacterized protein n=1 Tax=Araneus ventricosus TaxID=182803 RepID=A0A4Y2NN52_ARAVE|nr:hypothetical protein AVEN_217420-1 [Araneus ventricosus]